MRAERGIRIGSWMFVVCCLLNLTACEKPKSGEWVTEHLPGIYQVKVGAFVETITVNTNSTFSHVVKIDGETAVSESGSWRYNYNQYGVYLEPFTRYYDYDRNGIVIGAQGVEEKSIMFPLILDDQIVGISLLVDARMLLDRIEEEDE